MEMFATEIVFNTPLPLLRIKGNIRSNPSKPNIEMRDLSLPCKMFLTPELPIGRMNVKSFGKLKVKNERETNKSIRKEAKTKNLAIILKSQIVKYIHAPIISNERIHEGVKGNNHKLISLINKTRAKLPVRIKYRYMTALQSFPKKRPIIFLVISV